MLLYIELNRKNFYIINQYCQYNDSIEDYMSKLSNMRFQSQQHRIIYYIDVNAKLSLWFSFFTDQKEEIVEKTQIPSGIWVWTYINISGT